MTSVFLIFVAAGMLTYGVHELESGGVIPYIGGETQIEDDNIIATRVNGDTKSFSIDKEKKAKKWASRCCMIKDL